MFLLLNAGLQLEEMETQLFLSPSDHFTRTSLCQVSHTLCAVYGYEAALHFCDVSCVPKAGHQAICIYTHLLMVLPPSLHP